MAKYSTVPVLAKTDSAAGTVNTNAANTNNDLGTRILLNPSNFINMFTLNKLIPPIQWMSHLMHL